MSDTKKTPDNFAGYVDARIKELGLDFKTAAARAKMTRQGLYKLLDSNGEKAQLSTIINLANAIKVHPFVLLRLIFNNLIHKFTEENALHLHDASGFITDITLPDGVAVYAKQNLVKTWEIVNNGSIDWIDRYLVCVDEKLEVTATAADFAAPHLKRGLIPQQTRTPIPLTHPGQSVQLTVNLIAPDYPGSFISYWKMVDNAGNFCFPTLQGLSCLVTVISI